MASLPNGRGVGGCGGAPLPKKLKKLSTENRLVHLSEMSRGERKANKEANSTEFYFGRLLAERMMAREHEPENVVVSESVRTVLAGVPESSDTLDLRSHIAHLSEGEVWSAVSSCPHVTKLLLAGWRGVGEKPLRSMGIALGDRLEVVDLSDTPVTDGMLEVFASRLFALKDLRLSHCPNVGQLGLCALTNNAAQSLTALDLSKSLRVDSDVLGWVAGTQGHRHPPCRRLQALNASECLLVADAGLVQLGAGGCPALRFVNFASCELVTDKGVVALAKGCPKLKVVSLPQLPQTLTDLSLKALGKRCPELNSLNVARSGTFTDAGIKALVKGCRSLQALNIAGAVAVTERGLGYIVSQAPNIATLNVTGCAEITVNGLRAAVEGNGFVTEARSFFGFYPSPGAVEAKISKEQHFIEDDASRRIQQGWHLRQLRKAAAAELVARRRNRAAKTIQLAFERFQFYQDAKNGRANRKRTHMATEVQRCFRGYQARQDLARAQAHRKWVEGQAPLWIRVQTQWRGYHCRTRDAIVGRALVELYANRRREAIAAAAVFAQATVRRFLGRLRMGGWRELKGQRWRDRDLGSRRIQQCARMYNAYRRMLELKVYKDEIFKSPIPPPPPTVKFLKLYS
jgi:hypothetical protein